MPLEYFLHFFSKGIPKGEIKLYVDGRRRQVSIRFDHDGRLAAELKRVGFEEQRPFLKDISTRFFKARGGFEAYSSNPMTGRHSGGVTRDYRASDEEFLNQLRLLRRELRKEGFSIKKSSRRDPNWQGVFKLLHLDVK